MNPSSVGADNRPDDTAVPSSVDDTMRMMRHSGGRTKGVKNYTDEEDLLIARAFVRVWHNHFWSGHRQPTSELQAKLSVAYQLNVQELLCEDADSGDYGSRLSRLHQPVIDKSTGTLPDRKGHALLRRFTTFIHPAVSNFMVLEDQNPQKSIEDLCLLYHDRTGLKFTSHLSLDYLRTEAKYTIYMVRTPGVGSHFLPPGYRAKTTAALDDDDDDAHVDAVVEPLAEPTTGTWHSEARVSLSPTEPQAEPSTWLTKKDRPMGKRARMTKLRQDAEEAAAQTFASENTTAYMNSIEKSREDEDVQMWKCISAVIHMGIDIMHLNSLDDESKKSFVKEKAKIMRLKTETEQLKLEVELLEMKAKKRRLEDECCSVKQRPRYRSDSDES